MLRPYKLIVFAFAHSSTSRVVDCRFRNSRISVARTRINRTIVNGLRQHAANDRDLRSCFVVILSAGTRPSFQVDYGKSECSYCRMIIDKKQFGGEIETRSGKVLVFDAVECLAASYYREWNVPVHDIKAIRVVDYAHPGTLIKATTATFVRTASVESPMGANIVAFSSRSEAHTMIKAPGDSVMTWTGCIGFVRAMWSLPPPGNPGSLQKKPD